MEGTIESPQRLPGIVPADQGLTRDRRPLPRKFGGESPLQKSGNGDRLHIEATSPLRGISSVGRALEWHSRGQGFESPILHLGHFH